MCSATVQRQNSTLEGQLAHGAEGTKAQEAMGNSYQNWEEVDTEHEGMLSTFQGRGLQAHRCVF